MKRHASREILYVFQKTQRGIPYLLSCVFDMVICNKSKRMCPLVKSSGSRHFVILNDLQAGFETNNRYLHFTASSDISVETEMFTG